MRSHGRPTTHALESSARAGASAFVAAIAMVLLAGSPALAQEDDPSTPGALQVAQPDGTLVEMPLKHTSVAVEVTAFVARARIEQTFANPFQEPVEAVYTFPLGDRAAVDDFELVVGDRTIRGEIRRREEAREVYEQARSAGYQAALLEQERPNIFTQSVANLEPGREIKVRIRTVETLRYEKGVYQLIFPLVVGPRYIPGSRAEIGAETTGLVASTSNTPDADRISPPVLRPGHRSGHDVDISVVLDAGVPIRDLSSPSHRILVERRAAASARVSLAEGETIPNKDFMLLWNVSSDRPSVGLLAHRDGLDGFFTLLVQPRGEVTAVEASPKEIVLVLDTSGSMSGIPIEASKRFVARALRELGPRDTFNLIRFSGDNEVYSDEPLANVPGLVESAIGWVGAQQERGGTEMLAALRAAFALKPDPNRMRVVIFLTDGYVGNDPEILAIIREVVGQARIYTVGIGGSVNHYLLDRMADLGNGAYVFIRPDESADAAIESFRSWVTRPYLTELSVDWGALPIADVSPERLRDLSSGQTLVVVGRYLSAAEGDVVVRGKLGGSYWEQRLHVVLPEREARHQALGSLWARGRIEEQLLSSPGQVPDSVRAEVTSLALEYRLMSPFTSFVAVDDSRVVNPSGQSRTVRQALPMPEGMSFAGVFGEEGPAALRTGGENRALEDRGAEAEIEQVRREAEQAERRRQVALTATPPRSSPATGGVEGGVPGGVLSGVPGGVLGGVLGGTGTTPGTSTSGVKDADGEGNPNVRGARAPDFKAVVSDLASAGPLPGHVTRYTDEFIQNLPVQGSFYQNLLTFAPGTQEVERESAAVRRSALGARSRLLDRALRVLADLADDGRLSPAEGKPSLAALLAAQRPSGAVAEDVGVQAVATWALAEAAARMPGDPWLSKAATKAADYLAGLAGSKGWPARTGGELDAEATRWARLVLRGLRPEAARAVPVPAGEPSPGYKQLREALASSKTGAVPAARAGRSPFERLVASIGRGNLRVVRL